MSECEMLLNQQKNVPGVPQPARWNIINLKHIHEQMHTLCLTTLALFHSARLIHYRPVQNGVVFESAYRGSFLRPGSASIRTGAGTGREPIYQEEW